MKWHRSINSQTRCVYISYSGLEGWMSVCVCADNCFILLCFITCSRRRHRSVIFMSCIFSQPFSALFLLFQCANVHYLRPTFRRKSKYNYFFIIGIVLELSKVVAIYLTELLSKLNCQFASQWLLWEMISSRTFCYWAVLWRVAVELMRTASLVTSLRCWGPACASMTSLTYSLRSHH